METHRTPGWGWILPSLVVPFIGSLFYFVWFSDSPIGKTAYGATKIFTLGFPIAVLLFFRHRFLAPWFDLHQGTANRRLSVVAGIVSGVLIAGAILGLFFSPVGETVWAAAPQVREKASQLGFAQHFLLFAVFLSVIHSALEEFYWRWFVFGNVASLLNSSPSWIPHTIAACAFSAHHLVVTSQFFPLPFAVFCALGTGVGGAIWSILYKRTGSLTGAWISHFFADVAIMVIGYLLLEGSL